MGTFFDDYGVVVGLGLEIGEWCFVACTGTFIILCLVLIVVHCGSGLDIDVVVETASAYVGRFGDDVDDIIGFTDGWVHLDKVGLDYDFGMVVFERDVDVEFIVIWLDSIDEDFVGTEVTVVGWGQMGVDEVSGGTK